MVLGEQALEHFAARAGADGVADAVVLGEVFNFVEVVRQVEVLPAVSIADGEVECDVQAAKFEKISETAGCSIGVTLRGLPDGRQGQVASVEEVVGRCQPKTKILHDPLTVIVILLSNRLHRSIPCCGEVQRQR